MSQIHAIKKCKAADGLACNKNIIQVWHREHELKSRYKQSIDWGAEREAQAGRPLNERERALAEEIRRVKDHS